MAKIYLCHSVRLLTGSELQESLMSQYHGDTVCDIGTALVLKEALCGLDIGRTGWGCCVATVMVY